jgi:hypothetical protein
MSKKNSNWKWNALAIAAAVAAAAVPASAQDAMLEATIPFAFSISKGANLAPGNYIVTRDRNVWQFRNEETLNSVAFVNVVGRQGQAADEQPLLTFECWGNHCQLRAIHVGGIELGAEVVAPRVSKSDRAEVALLSVPLKPLPRK